ncbi:MAG TPA: hypothetical protein PLE74_03225 [Candidatus Cloacimonadota bacterium]|nr:hypothetical protein [Candidatus Cloacimonadota bacterium]HPT71272.1 hypothetical protein [Candidatus Cloacimonadota bacterium]
MSLWTHDVEIDFFRKSLNGFSTPGKLFYSLNKEYYAYVPKRFSANGKTLQSRNSLIGQYTEKWCKSLFEPYARKLNLYAVNGVICEELGLTRQSSADLAFCTEDSINQKAENIKLIFEIKMSIVSNYKYEKSKTIQLIGDYFDHKGNPSLLRSDSMLKAIGKAINIRVSGRESARIPIVILGNSPITLSYEKKVDFLKESGVIQEFWSLYPNPSERTHIVETTGKGFLTVQNENDLLELCSVLVQNELCYFSSMKSKNRLGEIIGIANNEKTDLARAEKFLQLIRE